MAALYGYNRGKDSSVKKLFAGKKRIKRIALALLLVLLVVWTVWGNLTLTVTRYKLFSDKLPEAFNRWKIVHISDLHSAEFGKNNQSLIDLVRKEKPDMIAITGDLVDSGDTELNVALSLVHELMQLAPCYYVTGNHESRMDRDLFYELKNKLLEEGVQVLRNQRIIIEKEGQIIQLVGLDDPDFTNWITAMQSSILQMTLNRMDLTEDYCILLSHRPEAFDAYVAEGMDLVLSGHTHGGQFRLPIIGGIIAPNQGLFPEYDAGKYSKKDTTMIVSRGIGNSIIPLRFNNPPELVVVELIRR